MDLDKYIQSYLEHDRTRLAINSYSANDSAQTWISTIKNAPRSIDAIQSLMDTKEVEMNKVNDVSELQRLEREWSALEWLQGVIRQVQNEQQLRRS
jgi:hypothetical protein